MRWKCTFIACRKKLGPDVIRNIRGVGYTAPKDSS